MSEPKNVDLSKIHEEAFRPGLKSLKLEEIEALIAKVLGDAVGREYEAKVGNINFNTMPNSDVFNAMNSPYLYTQN